MSCGSLFATVLRRQAVRLDRTLTLGLFGPLGRLRMRGSSHGIPILMYHSVSQDLDDTVHPYFRTVTSPEKFALQVGVLRAAGYAAVTLSQALGELEDSKRGVLPAHGAPKVVITFDDGFRDFHDSAYPVLQAAGYTATVFLPTAFIGRRFVTGRDCLGAAEVRSLAEQGIEFGSHSATHRRLVDLGAHELRTELHDSKAAIEDATGREVKTFSYPYRFPEQDEGFVARLGGLLDECGYSGGVTTAIGRASGRDDRRFLPRLPVNDCDDEALLRAKLLGHYDWLRSGQRARKRTRALWQELGSHLRRA
jgi:peptidoglycan/xylan/chitin deacetylase (PgdA/CDA1 family)